MSDKHTERHDNELKNIRRVFKSLKFKYVSDINISTGKGGGDIDLVCYDSKTLFYIELKNGETRIKENFAGFLMKRNSDTHFLKNNYQKTKKLEWNKADVKYFFFIPNTFQRTEKILREQLDKQPNNQNIFIIRNLNEFSYLSEAVDPVYAKREFFLRHGVEPETSGQISVPAIKSPISKKGTIYQFTCSAKELVKFASVPRRSENKKDLANYQRLVVGKRLKQIASNHIDKKKDFVNNIILRLEEKKIEFKSNLEQKNTNKKINNKIEAGNLTIKMDYNAAFIIDGQHRLLSYYKSKEDDLIRVSGLVGITESEEAQYFIDINDQATTVPKELIWDLTADLSPRSSKGTISRIFKRLQAEENKIFYKKMEIPSIPRKKKLNKEGKDIPNGPKLSFAGLCRTVLQDCDFDHTEKWPNYKGKNVSNPFFNKNFEVDRSAKLISHFFDSVFQNFSPEKIEKFFNDGVIAVYVEICFVYYKSYGIKGEEQALVFLRKIVDNIDDQEIKDRKGMNDGAKKKEHKRIILYEIQKKFPDFGIPVPKISDLQERAMEFEGEFREWVYKKIMEDQNNEEWLIGIYGNKIKKWKEDNKWEYKKNRDYWDNLGFNDCIELVTRTQQKYNFWKNIFEDVFMEGGFLSNRGLIEAGHNLYKKRNPKGHSSKQITTSSDFMPGRYNRAEEDLKRFKKIVEKN